LLKIIAELVLIDNTFISYDR